MTTPSYPTKTRRSRNKKQHLLTSKNNILESSAVSPSKKVEAADAIIENHVTICSTPKAKRFRIPEMATCPPAPKKRRIHSAAAAAAATYSFRPTPVPFFAPPDIELFFYYALRGIPV